MWNAAVTIFDDEDEEALISRFVELSAIWTNEDAISICRYLFKDMRDPELRAGQAAITWSNDLAVKERIRQHRLTGGNVENEVATKVDKLKVLEGIYKDSECSAKDKIAAIELHAKIQGEIIKAIEQSNNDKRQPNQVIYTVGDFARAAQ